MCIIILLSSFVRNELYLNLLPPPSFFACLSTGWSCIILYKQTKNVKVHQCRRFRIKETIFNVYMSLYCYFSIKHRGPQISGRCANTERKTIVLEGFLF